MTQTSCLQGASVKIHTPADFSLLKFQAFAEANDLLGLDVESLPLDVIDKANMWGHLRSLWLRLVQVGNDEEAWNLDPQDPQQRAALVWLFRRQSSRFISWSPIDPICISVCLGVDITSRYFDGLTLALLLEPGELEAHGLKEWAARLGLPELREAEARLHERWDTLRQKAPVRPRKPRKGETDTDYQERLSTWQRANEAYERAYPVCGWNGWRDTPLLDPAYQEYAGLDAIVVFIIWPRLVEMCKERGVYGAVANEIWLQQFATRMTITGMRIDREWAQRHLDDVGARHHAAKAEFTQITGGILPGSIKRVEWFRSHGIESSGKTKTGAPSFGQQHVDDMIIKYAQNPGDSTETGRAALAILKRVAETKNLTDFVTTLLALCDPDGFVHPNIRTLGAETGRWTVGKPGVQTLSNGGAVRGCFSAADGYVLVSIDQSQIEVRIAAALSGETSLIEAFNRGEDAYDTVARTLFGNEFTKRQRSMAKRVVLATLYGAGVATIVRQLHDLDGIVVDERTVSEVRSQFRRQYRRIQEFARRVNNGEDVWLYSGRYVPGDMERTYRGINSYCQGTGRDTLMDTLRRAVQKGYGHTIRMTFHDEIMFELPVKGLRQALLDLRECFIVPFRDVSISCDIEVYPERWGEGMLIPRPEGLCRRVKDDQGTRYELEMEWVA